MAGNIVEYNAPTGLGLQPTETGINSTAQAARRVQSRANEVAGAFESVGASANRAIKNVGDIVVDHITQQNIASASAALAEKQNGYIKEWNNLDNKDDPTVLKNFRDGMEADLQQFKDKAFLTDKGQAWGERHIEAFRNHMYEKTTNDLSAIAGHKTVTSIMKSANEWSATAMGDPSSVKFLLAQADDGIAGIVDHSTNLTPAQQAQIKGEHTQKIKEQIVRAAMFGAIQQDPANGIRLAQDPALAPYINGVEIKQFETYQRQQARLKTDDEERAIRLEEHRAKRVSDAKSDQYRQWMTSDDPEERSKLTMQGVYNDPDLLPREKDHIVSLIKAWDKDEPAATVSSRNTDDLFDRITLPDGDPRKLTDTGPIDKMKRGLTRADHDWLIKKFREAQSPDGSSFLRTQAEFFGLVKPLIVHANVLQSNGGVADVGTLDFWRYKSFVESKIEEYRKAGKNPRDLFNPGNSDYVGSDAALVPYQKSLQQSMQNLGRVMPRDRQAPAPAPAPARRPGESSADYEKRLNLTQPVVPQSTR